MTQAGCDQASDLANTLGELEAKCLKLHGVEKAPHLEAGRAVDRRWFPLRDFAGDVKQRLKRLVVTPFLRKKEEEAEKAAIAAISAGAAPETVPQPKITAGTVKRSTALRTQTSAEVEDWKMLMAALAEHPDDEGNRAEHRQRVREGRHCAARDQDHQTKVGREK